MDPVYAKTVIEVTCPRCNVTYNLRTDKHKFARNCRCSMGSFEIELGTGYNHLRVFFTDDISGRKEFKNWRIISQSLS